MLCFEDFAPASVYLYSPRDRDHLNYVGRFRRILLRSDCVAVHPSKIGHSRTLRPLMRVCTGRTSPKRGLVGATADATASQHSINI